jgi:hypothetical protein
MKFRSILLAALLASSSAGAQDVSQYDHFYSERIEGLYVNNWYVMLRREDEGIMYLSIIADGKLPCSGTFMTACNSSFPGMMIPEEGLEYYIIEADVLTELSRWVCTS